MKPCVRPIAVTFALVFCAAAAAQVDPIECISDIEKGVTIDFEEPGSRVNEILSKYDMRANPDATVTTFASWVVGNACAPIKRRAGFGQGIQITTTGQGWNKIGLTGIGSLLGVDRRFTLIAYDKDGDKLGDITRTFVAGNSQEEYNAGAVFLGLSSATPIHSVLLLADNPNVGWDHLRFQSSPGFPKADLNCDGSVDLVDVEPFSLALLDPDNYDKQYPNCDIDLADINDDGSVDLVDVEPFIDCLLHGGCP